MHIDTKNKKSILLFVVSALLFGVIATKYIIEDVLPHYSKVGYWAKGPSMNKSMYIGSAARLKHGNIFVIGQNNAEIYLPNKNKFIKTNKPIIDRDLSPLLMLMQDGRVLIFGGVSASKFNKIVEAYDPNTR